jgi:hypothetical protein
MPKTRSSVKKQVNEQESKNEEVGTFSTSNIAPIVDRSTIDLGHKKVMQQKDKEVKKTQKKPHHKTQARNQKKQLGMKRNPENIKKTKMHGALR